MTKKLVLITLIPLILLISCATDKNGKKQTQEVQDKPLFSYEEIVILPEEKVSPISPTETKSNQDYIVEFDSIKITKETFNSTKTEIGLVVEDLNKITVTRDYQKWLLYLSPGYKEYYSSPIVLKEVSESLPIKGVQLKTLKDYFNFVFVPSRQNMRVDDIKFVSPTRVYVIMEIAPNSPAAIYILEKAKDRWSLVLKNQ
ncbi:MAG TPA: hypothetical protein VJ861_01680 [Treponemataceae bacterium]|nr:hypothetical protein [Treponemataceae bacterium]